jgi:hypothetical protein
MSDDGTAPRGPRHAVVVLAAFSLFYALFFSPALLAGRLLAPFDGQLLYWPYFVSPVTLWTDLLLGGFPVAADPQAASWYPVARLFALLPGSWNAYVISAYVLASAFTYGYVHALTRTPVAAAGAGLAFGLCGFMIGHLPHASMLHSTAWIPLAMWSVHELRRGAGAAWIVIGAAAVAMSALAGHPQLFVYALVLTSAYALVLGLARRRPGAAAGTPAAFLAFAVSPARAGGRYLARAGAVLVLGVALAAVQLIPTHELSSMSDRWRMGFGMFSTASLPPRQTLTLLFPYAFGGDPWSPYGTDYFGEPNLNEFSGYVGLLPLLLVAPALVARRRSPVVWFWAAVALLALWLAWGAATPLWRLIHHVPVYNKFRAPARHVMHVALAVSVLSGLGIAAILRSACLVTAGRASRRAADLRRLNRVLVGATALTGTGLIGLAVLVGRSAIGERLRAGSGGGTVLTHPALAIPLLVFACSATALLVWSRKPASRARQAALLAVLVCDLGSFGWFMSWRYRSPTTEYLAPGPHVQAYRERLARSGQRLLSERAAAGPPVEFQSNLTRVWGVRSAVGTNALIPLRLGEFYPIDASGRVGGRWADEANRSLDLMAVRYVVRPAPEQRAAADSFPLPPPHWVEVERIEDAAIVYENRRAMPQAWMVSEVVRARPELVLDAIHTSRLPGGRPYDPRATALVEPPFPRARQEFDRSATVGVVGRRETEVRLRTTAAGEAFLVLSDVHYPGWAASVDGRATPVFRVNYVQRGIRVPAGTHDVRFAFRPRSFYAGAGVSGAAGLVLLGLLGGRLRSSGRRRRAAGLHPTPDPP